ncbi:MAG: hydrogenase maturation protease [Gammaproteobacteria bacterium]|nr:hydrogenase maturation protease [Gammaproteobacteria bacterium]
MDGSSATLVLGYGNPARGDDGLGPALIERLATLALEDLETRVDYQLCVEDALDIGDFDQVIFVDASIDVAPPYLHYPLPATVIPATLDTHGISPEALIHLARTLFGAETKASILAIRGYDFEPFSESLSAEAARNLDAAFNYLAEKLREREAGAEC